MQQQIYQMNCKNKKFRGKLLKLRQYDDLNRDQYVTENEEEAQKSTESSGSESQDSGEKQINIGIKSRASSRKPSRYSLYSEQPRSEEEGEPQSDHEEQRPTLVKPTRPFLHKNYFRRSNVGLHQHMKKAQQYLDNQELTLPGLVIGQMFCYGEDFLSYDEIFEEFEIRKQMTVAYLALLETQE